MSFTLRYRPFVRLRVKDRDSDEALVGFDFRPTPSCVRSMADHRLVFRAGAGGFDLVYRENPEASDPLMGPVRLRTRFTFGMRHRDPAFLRRFEPDLPAGAGPSFHFDNLTPAGNIQTRSDLSGSSFVQEEDAVRIVPSVFSLALGADEAGQATLCRVEPRFSGSGAALEIPVAVPSGSRDAWVRVDLSGHAPGAYTVATDVPGASPRPFYVSDEVFEARTLAVVDVHWEKEQDTVPSSGVEYQIRFRSR